MFIWTQNVHQTPSILLILLIFVINQKEMAEKLNKALSGSDFEFEELLILLGQGVLGLGEDVNEVVFGEVVHHGENR